MYHFGKTSLERLKTTNPILQEIFLAAIVDSPLDFGIPQFGGSRTPEEQNLLYKKGKSNADGYNRVSYHQSGFAVDIFPYVNGKANYDIRYCFMLIGHIVGTAKRLGYRLTTGADWDGDLDLDDQKLKDLVHFELRG